MQNQISKVQKVTHSIEGLLETKVYERLSLQWLFYILLGLVLFLHAAS